MEIELMLNAPEDIRKDARRQLLQAKGFPKREAAMRGCLSRPCPNCGSRMVRSRDLRDLCLVCGYLQSQA